MRNVNITHTHTHNQWQMAAECTERRVGDDSSGGSDVNLVGHAYSWVINTQFMLLLLENTRS